MRPLARTGVPAALVLAFLVNLPGAARAQQPEADERAERFRRMSERAEAEGLAEPFVGVTTDGTPVPGLFAIRSTGVSTSPVRTAADAFLATLSDEQRARTTFPVDDPEWRK